jgi:uncharacterized membrane protein YuzA (DUF378 family)
VAGVSVVIPANIIQAIYVHPHEAYIKPFGKAWRFMEASTKWMYAIIVFGVVFANVFGRPSFSDPVAYLILGVVAIVVFVIVTIKLVEKSESKAKVDNESPAEAGFHVGFDSSGVTVEKQMSSEHFSGVIPRSDIKKISGYVQGGWLGARDRGVVIERNDGAQFRFVLSIQKSRLNDFLSEFELSLKQLNYPVEPLRTFQV